MMGERLASALRTHADMGGAPCRGALSSLTPGKGHTRPPKETRPWRSPFTEVHASQACAGVLTRLESVFASQIPNHQYPQTVKAHSQ